jgi:hypothetical protein
MDGLEGPLVFSLFYPTGRESVSRPSPIVSSLFYGKVKENSH